MMNWKVAPSYTNDKILSIDEKSHKAYIEQVCDRCGGTGMIVSRVENGRPIPIPVDGGVCYKCGGTKKISKWVKAYTEDEYARYINSQKRAKAKKEADKQAYQDNLINKSASNKAALLEKLGYDPEDPKVYIVTGENTYNIKDELKANGARFERALGWYVSHEIELPEGYKFIVFEFDKLYNWDPLARRIELKREAKQLVDEAIAAITPKSNSQYIGEPKERIRDMKVVLTAVHTFDGTYGMTTIYTFKRDEDVLVWMTSSCKDIEVGDELLLTGTIKSHDEYKGVKQTKLSRCIIKNI